MYKTLIFLIFTMSYVEASEAPKSPDIFTYATRALLSYDHIKERADELVIEIKQKAFGEYSNEVLMLLPIVTGQIEFSISELRFYHQQNKEKTGVEYVYKF